MILAVFIWGPFLSARARNKGKITYNHAYDNKVSLFGQMSVWMNQVDIISQRAMM